MKKKGQKTFNNENAEKLLTALPLPKALPQVRQNVSLLRVCLGLKNFLGPRDPKRIGRA